MNVWYVLGWIAIVISILIILPLVFIAIREAWYSRQQRKKMRMSEAWLLRQHREGKR